MPPRLKSSYKTELEAATGEEFSFKCPIRKADPPASVSWHHNGRIVFVDSEEPASRYRLSGKRLTILSVAPDDEGEYVCIAGNGYGKPVIANFTLQISGEFIIIKCKSSPWNHSRKWCMH